jgi:hypothetical protein
MREVRGGGGGVREMPERISARKDFSKSYVKFLNTPTYSIFLFGIIRYCIVRYYCGDQIGENGVDTACSKHGR